jgi:sugar/nucleoside kinase (ribokinase family)
MNSTKKYDVLVVGELNVDIILYDIKKEIALGKEIFANDMVLTLGSSSAILANNLSVWGSKVAFLGKIGSDVFSKIILDTLQKSNVDTKHIIISQNSKTGATIALSYGNERAMVTYPGAMSELQESNISDEILEKAKHLHISSIFMQEALLPDVHKLFKRAKKLGLTTSLDTQWDPFEKWNVSFKEILPYVDVFLPNKEEFLIITNSRTIKEGYEKIKDYSNIVVIKDSINGSHLFSQKEKIYQPAFIMEEIIDAIGAGDSYNAGFLKEFIQNKDLKTCMIEGTLSGAINTQGEGGTGAFTDFETLEKHKKRILNER